MNINKKWRILADERECRAADLGKYSAVVANMLMSRGICTETEAEAFLAADYKLASDPFLFNKMTEAVDLIVGHIKAGDLIYVYGDYDADGVTSSAIMLETLRTLKANVDIYIPDRAREGYGLNVASIDIIADAGGKLIITVDNGIRGAKEIELAHERGIDVVITDHHQSPEEEALLPKCLILNPHFAGESYPFKDLAGAGVAFKLAQAIIRRSKLADNEKNFLEERLLDLVALGTVADCVPLLGENRILVKKGLEVLNKTRRMGMLDLIKVSQSEGKTIKAWSIGFQLAPRLNAAGRMQHANTAFELLVADDKEKSRSLALQLNQRNVERQQITEEIFNSVDALVQDQLNDKILIAVFPINQEKEEEIWSEGVIGLVAGRICEKYYRPTLVVTKSETGYKGSGRSVEQLDLIKAIEGAGEFLTKFGGHPMACGFSTSNELIDGFFEKMKQSVAEKLQNVELAPELKIDSVLDLKDIDMELLLEIDTFEPFGQNNDRPKFIAQNITIVDRQLMGMEAQHIKFKVKQEDSSIFQAIGFNQAEKRQDYKVGDVVDMVFYPEINDYNGRTDIQLKIVDMRRIGPLSLSGEG